MMAALTSMQTHICRCLQADRFRRLQITVYESLVFSARLRHSRETEEDIIFAFVREVRCHPDHVITFQLTGDKADCQHHVVE